MITYNEKYTVKPSGLNNIGVTCWGNSLLQTLFSLPALNKLLGDVTTTEPALNLYIKMLKSDIAFRINNSGNFCRLLCGNKMDVNKQNCAAEGFTSFCELLFSNFPTIEDVFYVRTQFTSICPTCKYVVSDRQYENNFVVMNYYSDIKHDFRKRLLIQPSSDLKIFTCGKCNTQNNISAVDNDRLVVTREIIAVVFNKYYDKKSIYYPLSFKIPESKTTFRQYNLVAEILHSGNMSSGHYIARALRDTKWYNFNDSSASALPHRDEISHDDMSIYSRTNAYMVFYHLVN